MEKMSEMKKAEIFAFESPSISELVILIIIKTRIGGIFFCPNRMDFDFFPLIQCAFFYFLSFVPTLFQFLFISFSNTGKGKTILSTQRSLVTKTFHTLTMQLIQNCYFIGATYIIIYISRILKFIIKSHKGVGVTRIIFHCMYLQI